MSDVLTFALPLLAILIGGGGLGAFMQARTSKKLGVQQNENEKESVAVTGLKGLAEALTADVAQLREDRAEDRKQIDELYLDMGKLRVEQEELKRQNNNFHAVILAVIEMLRRNPPPRHADILEHILLSLPWLRKDKE